MNKLLILFLSLLTTALFCQHPEGKITYNRKTDWISIMSKLPYISKAEVDRSKLTWGKNENKGQNYELFIKDNKTLYTRKEEVSESSYSWNQEKIFLIRDYNNNKLKDLREEIGTKFLMEDNIIRTRWKILNEIKEVAGYLCMKAETKDTIKDQTIHAWFTDQIPMSGGPEGYGGLPGVILELEINGVDAVITATEIDMETPLDKLPIPKKMKGKKMDYAAFHKTISNFIDQSIEGRKNPYWRIRY